MTALGALLSNHSVLPGWELMGTTAVTVATNSVTISALDGDRDEHYTLTAMIINDDAATATYEMRPNGLTTGVQSRRIRAEVGGVSTDTSTTMRISVVLAGENMCMGAGMHVATGSQRVLTGTATESRTSLAEPPELEILAGIWDDTVTNLTSIEIFSDVASGIGIGSVFKIYRQKEAFSTE